MVEIPHSDSADVPRVRRDDVAEPETSQPPLRPLRVLLVEDSVDDATLILAALRRAGYDVHNQRVATAPAMQEALAQEPWDLILSDYAMPGFGGLEALAMLRDSGLDLPFLIVSGTIGEATAVEAMKAGAHDYLMKGNLARLGPAIEREWREAEVRRERRRADVALEEDAEVFEALARVGRELIACSDTAVLLERLCRVTVEVLDCDCSFTLLHGKDDDSFVPVAGFGGTTALVDEVRGLRLPRNVLDGLLKELDRDEIVQVSTAAPPTPWAALPQRFGVTVMLYLVLRRGDRISGIHSAGYFGRTEPFTPVQERIARGCGQLASMALQTVQLVDELEDANRLKSEFVATMSHELRTPLNIILGYGDLLLGGEFGALAPAQADAMRRIDKTARDLLGIVGATLDLSRFDRGDAPMAWSDANVAELLGEMEEELRVQARAPGVRLVWDVADDLPTLRTDVAKLKVILRNLVANAIKFTKRGKVGVSARSRNGGVEVAIADSGVGIAPEVLPIIFEPFRQGESAETRQFGGVGLGLHIVDRLLDLIQGSITVETTVGKGSTFRVWLPVEPE